MEPALSRHPWSFWNLIYTHNPFYLLSALLILYGLRLSFDSPVTVRTSCVLAISLAAYAAILTAMGWLVVRYGIWDDARTILLAVLIVLLSLGNSFDLLAIRHVEAGRLILFLSFVYAIALGELLLAALRIRLPLALRAPCHLMLALIYLYPLYLARVVDTSNTWPPVAWAMLLLSPLAAFSILLFLPATRLPRERFFLAGTPWEWPWFPWVLPAVLVLGLFGRCYMLSYSFVPVQGNAAAMEPYFFVLPLLALAVVAIELARANGCRRVEHVLTILGGLVVLLPVTSAQHAYQDRFLPLIVAQLGSPLFLTFVTLAVFYGYVWLRGNRLAELGLYAALASLVFVAPQTVHLRAAVAAQWLPLVLATLVAGYQALRWRTSYRWVWGAGMLLLMGSAALRETAFVAHEGFLPRHLALLLLLLIAHFCHDAFTFVVRGAAALLLAATCIAGAVHADTMLPAWGDLDTLIYEIALLSLGVWFAWRMTSYFLLATVAFAVAGTLSVALWPLIEDLRRVYLREGFEPIVGGVACMLLAIAISLAKMGACRRWPLPVRRWRLI
ncbi:MAG: hypothetical protein KF708_05635 [Pirellulales bacterium]|nr:hypothetical protein [Pirellulales bacterium]